MLRSTETLVATDGRLEDNFKTATRGDFDKARIRLR